ncbi:peptidase inhibitor family I36 protein [Saccharopolyspora sp. NPDC002686]|uniref:peptidase inhibitor family I36 protein n=1 Tax=Saccharopolyspora sp. NPDC002686 TaxID=3154541 RepID=UPI0033169560
MSVRKRIFSVLGASALAFSGLLISGAAQAETAFSQPAAACPAEHVCLYTGPNATGKMASFQWGSPDLRGQGVDKAQWVINNRSQMFCLFPDYNYAGSCNPVWRTVPQGFSVPAARGPRRGNARVPSSG